MALNSENQEFEGRPEEKENQAANQTWFHGGVAGLAVGALVLPPSVTQVRCCADYGAGEMYSRERIYMTTSVKVAFYYAALASIHSGWVYEVRPIGAVEPDPDPSDSLAERSFHCDKAEVVTVVYQCTPADMHLVWREVCSPPILRFLASALKADGVCIE